MQAKNVLPEAMQPVSLAMKSYRFYSGGRMSKFPVLLILFVFGSAAAYADQISLKNGDRLTGTIVKSDGKTLLLHTDYAGDVSLSWDAVQAVDSKQPLHIELRDGKFLAGPVSTADGQLTVTTASGPVVAPLAQPHLLAD